MGEMSPWHWLIVIAIAVLLFGARRLPDAARSLGRSARILKAELRDEPPSAPPDGAPDPSGTGSGSGSGLPSGPESGPESDPGSGAGSERSGEHPRQADGRAAT